MPTTFNASVRDRMTDRGRRRYPYCIALGILTLSLFFVGISPSVALPEPDPTDPLRSSPGGRPLDLPSGGRGAAEDDEEDATETIAFYGSIYEGDAFFWCLDRSGSMGWGGQWEILRTEVESAIAELADDAEFGLVAFSSGTTIWKSTPVEATTAARNGAIEWLRALEPGGGTCLLPAARAMLTLAHASDRDRPVGFIVSDGLPYCNGVDTSSECLVAIPAANAPQIPVHTLYVASDSPGSDFLRALAQLLGGTFILVNG